MADGSGGSANANEEERAAGAVDELEGTLIADRYRVGRKLGAGGMGVVYLASHETLRKQVALKVLTTSGKIDREAIARFEREAITTANLNHPNIASGIDFGRLPDGSLYFVMEYLEGITLRRFLGEQGTLAPPRALSILQQVGGAIAAAHARDVVHRDLKPENVVITCTKEPLSGQTMELAKVIDFGIAKLRSATFGAGGTGLTAAGTVFGTPDYMAPEQVMGQAVDARADQYALGVLAFELFAGAPPFKADDVGQLMMMHVGAPIPSLCERRRDLPPAVDGVLAKMLAKLPDERFDSVATAMHALVAALSAGIVERPVASPPVTAPFEQGRPPLPNPTAFQTIVDPPRRPARTLPLLAIAAVVATVLVGLGVVLLVHRRAEKSEAPPELAAALADWKAGHFAAAGTVIGKALSDSPELAELDSLSRPLAAPVADDSANRTLGTLLDTTSLGASQTMAIALADVALTDDPKSREGALRLLRPRHRLLPNDAAARVRLRDAETCESFDAAKDDESRAATTATRRDLERLSLGECKSMLRVNRLCDACGAGWSTRAPSPSVDGPRNPVAPPAKGKDKGGRGKGRK